MSTQTPALRKVGASYATEMSDENREFCGQVRAFTERFDISIRRLSSMCDGGRNKFSGPTVHRLLHGQADDAVVERSRPLLAAAFVQFLEDRGYFPSEIETELSDIFDPKEYMKMIANRCPLSPEAIRFFGLNRDPFDVDHLPASDEIYSNDALDAVAARVKDAVMYQRFVAVVGEVGTGKTLLKLRVANELAESGKTRLLYPEFFDMEELSVPNIANALLTELGQIVPRDKSSRVKLLKETLADLSQQGIGVALILDEAHRLRDKVISSLKNFWEMTNGRSSRLLGVILFGQKSFAETRLRDVRFKEIRQRVQIIEMPRMQDAAAAYITHRIKIAGGDVDQLIEPKALDRICINAETPLALGNLTNEALMHAFGEEEHQVTASMSYFKNLSAGSQVLGIRRTAA